MRWVYDVTMTRTVVTVIVIILRVTSVPASRSVTIDLTPSVTTVKPGPRGPAWRGDRSRCQMKPSVVYDDSAEDVLSHDQVVMSESKDDQSAPPPSPDLNQGAWRHRVAAEIAFTVFVIIEPLLLTVISSVV